MGMRTESLEQISSVQEKLEEGKMMINTGTLE
jgi:hypothetical protein